VAGENIIKNSLSVRSLDESSGIIPGKCHLLDELDISSIEGRTWRKRALEEFSARLSGDGFPCLFGKKAWNSASVQYLFCEDQGTYEYANFLSGLTEYTRFVRETAMEERLYAPLVVFFSEDFYHGTRQHSAGWEALNWVHRRDEKPWPQEVP